MKIEDQLKIINNKLDQIIKNQEKGEKPSENLKRISNSELSQKRAIGMMD